MPTTPNLALPYPAASDTADVPRDIQALAVKLDAVAGGPLVTSLPGSPVDGQEVYYQADATNGVIWHLRYRSAASGSYKWEFVGGNAFYAERMAEDSFTAAAVTWFGVPNDPIVTVPLAGDYDVDARCYMSSAASPCNMLLGIRVGSTDPTAGTTSTQELATGANQPVNLSHARRLLAVAASTQVRQRYLCNLAGAATRGGVALLVKPVRVG